MISSKSSSMHIISGDNNPGLLKKIFWILINFIINIFSSLIRMDPYLKLSFHKTEDFEDKLNKINKTFTPTRTATDLYWLSIPKNEIIKNLGKIKVLDVGCGSGIYYYLLRDIFGEKLELYTGFDKKLRISSELKVEKNVNFIEDDVENLGQLAKNYNLIISNSFIEHIDNDLKMFENLKIIEENNHPTLQIHTFPAKPCLFTYLAHGIRQYSSGTVSKISKTFDNYKTRKFLIGLGSKYISNFHFNEITLKKIFRRKNNIERNNLEIYRNKFIDAYKKDLSLKDKININKANFYALILETNFNKKIDRY